MKKIFFLLSFFLSASAFSQNVFVANEVKSQPLVYRENNGSYSGCGIRTVFVTDVPKGTHVGDVSVNLFQQKSGNIVSMVKIMYSKVENPKDPNSVKNLPITKFMFATAAGKALPIGETKNGEVANTYLAQTSASDAIDYLYDAIEGKRTEIGVALKSDPGSMKVFSLKNVPLTKDEVAPLSACVNSLTQKK